MPIIRTPEERFANLSDFPFASHYAEVNGLRVHYVDEGKEQTVLCLHGEPTWSYLYRKMIPVLSAQHRVIAMDFIGFGRSDKFTPLEKATDSCLPTGRSEDCSMPPSLNVRKDSSLTGFTEQNEYSFKMHCDTLSGFIKLLSLNQITLVVQDWGGLIGLRRDCN